MSGVIRYICSIHKSCILFPIFSTDVYYSVNILNRFYVFQPKLCIIHWCNFQFYPFRDWKHDAINHVYVDCYTLWGGDWYIIYIKYNFLHCCIYYNYLGHHQVAHLLHNVFLIRINQPVPLLQTQLVKKISQSQSDKKILNHNPTKNTLNQNPTKRPLNH